MKTINPDIIFSKGYNPKTVFMTEYKDIEGRLDPEYLLYSMQTQNFKFETNSFSAFLKYQPQYGSNQAGTERYNNAEPRYIRITDIDENGNLIENIGVTANVIDEKYFLNNNDLLFARSGNTVGKAYLHKSDKVKYPCFYAGYMIRFVIDESKINPDYVFVITQLDFYKKWVKAVQRTTGQPNINAEEYKSLKIPVPPKEIQSKIVTEYNALNEKRLFKLKETKQILKSIDVYILNELGIILPVENNSITNRIYTVAYKDITNRKLDPYSNKIIFKKIKDAFHASKYPSVSLKDYSMKITSGATPLAGGDDYTTKDEGVPFIRSGEINEFNEINFDNCLYIKKEVHNAMLRSSQLKFHDVLIAIVGATIGQVAIYNDSREANINQALALVRLKNSVLPEYFKSFLFSSAGSKILDQLKRPVARANINLDEIGTIEFPLPPIEIQKKIIVYINNSRQKAQNILKKIEEEISKSNSEIEAILKK